MKLQDNPLGKIMHISKSIERRLEKNVAAECGLSHTDAKLIMMIKYNCGVNQKDLADGLQVSPPAVSRQLDKLEQAKLVSRDAAPGSKRETVTRLSKKGEVEYRKVESYIEKSLDAMLKELGGVDRDTTVELERLALGVTGGMGCVMENVREGIEKK